MAYYECKYNVKRIWKYGESTSEEQVAVNVQLLALYFAMSAILSQNICVPFSHFAEASNGCTDGKLRVVSLSTSCNIPSGRLV